MLVKELDEKKWEKFDVFGKKGFLRIATTDSGIDSIRLIDGNEKRVPYVTRSEAVNGIAQFVSATLLAEVRSSSRMLARTETKTTVLSSRAGISLSP